MKCNVGKTDQITRITIGMGIVVLGLFFKKWWGIIGIIPIITGATRYCPISDALELSTCDTKK